MTIIELEQGLRNLIASEPRVLQSINGPIVNSIMGLIDSTKNMIYRVQTYPAQDAFKFNMAAEIQRLEASITSLAIQNLQARGINLMLYIPQNIQFSQLMGQMLYSPNIVQPAPQMPVDINPYAKNVKPEALDASKNSHKVYKEISITKKSINNEKITVSEPESSRSEIEANKPSPVEKFTKTENKGTGKSAGRDYLVELLKK